VETLINIWQDGTCHMVKSWHLLGTNRNNYQLAVIVIASFCKAAVGSPDQVPRTNAIIAKVTMI
jgi:hypothetical protein